MRQAGLLAAAGIFALENNIARLSEDHENARKIGEALNKKSFVANLATPETNILVFEVLEPYTTAGFIEYFSQHAVLLTTISPRQLRMVTHYEITTQMVNSLVAIIENM